MTHDELLQKLADIAHNKDAHDARNRYLIALRAVVELHQPQDRDSEDELEYCVICPDFDYPCQTIKAIKKELGNG